MSLDPERNPWQTKSSQTIYDNPWIRLDEHQVVQADGQDSIYGCVHFKNQAVAVLPIDAKGNTWLVGQYRYPLQQYSWEIPIGGGKLDQDPKTTALRELEEETGLKAQRLDPLIRCMHVSNSTTDEYASAWLARDLTMGQPKPDGCEVLQSKCYPIQEAIAMAHREEITDLLSCTCLFKVERLIERGELQI